MKLFINKTIGNSGEMARWMFGIDEMSFSDIHDYLNYVAEWYPHDNTIDVELHSCGGDCVEGYAIYDALRTSGKEITCSVVGVAASMATIILLAAPKEKRFMYEHAQLLIHSPYFPSGTSEELTIERLSALQAHLEQERKKMLDLYVERTGASEEALSEQMAKGNWFGSEQAIALGFVAGVIPATSAQAEMLEVSTTAKAYTNENMKLKEKETALGKAFLALGKALGLVDAEGVETPKEAKAMTLTATDGSELNIEREEGEPQVGDKASPNGTFVLEDGRTIVVEEGAITDIKTDDPDENEDEEVEALKAEIAELKEKLGDANAKVEAQTTAYAELMEAMAKRSSAYTPAGRNNQPEEPAARVSKTSQELQALRAKLNK